MAAAVEAALGVRVELVEGSGGVFAVSVDGDVVFAKPKGGRFPGGDEIVAIVRARGVAEAPPRRPAD